MPPLRAWIHAHPRLSIAAGTLLLLWLTHEFLNWRMEREWEAYRREAIARGVKLDLAELIPPEVPDADNFASTPLLAASFGGARSDSLPLTLPKGSRVKWPGFGDRFKGEPIDWTAWQEFFFTTLVIKETSGPTTDPVTEVLRALQTYEPQRAEWRAASARPYSRFPLEYDRGWVMPMPHLRLLQDAAHFFVLRMNANLARGDTAAAREDFREILQAARALESEATLTSRFVRRGTTTLACNAVGNGLAGHQWTDADLQQIASEFSHFHPLDDYQIGMKCVRALNNGFWEQIVAAGPIGREKEISRLYGASKSFWSWERAAVLMMPARVFRENQLHTNRYFDELVAPGIPGPVLRKNLAARFGFENPFSEPDQLFLIWSKTLTGGLDGVRGLFQGWQAALSQTVIACALERYWLAHGVYPDSLAELSPQFLPHVPEDPFGSAPMKYRRAPRGSFLLYSVGKNQIDDGGVMDRKKSEYNQPDMIWLYAPPESAPR